MNTELGILEKKLLLYLPEKSIFLISDWIRQHNVKLKITKSRNSKHGDYYAPRDGHGHLITINYDLSQYEFLITLVHEFAHLKVHLQSRSFFKRKSPKPHGPEWKLEYRNLLLPILTMDIFPDEISNALSAHLKNPAASSCSDPALQRMLRKYTPGKDKNVLLEELEDGMEFRLANGMHFRKIKKLRKNYQCLELNKGTYYFVSPVAEITIV